MTEYINDIFSLIGLLIYILHNYFLGLLIGYNIAYGLKQNKYSNKKVLFILILLCSFITQVKSIFIHSSFSSYTESFTIIVNNVQLLLLHISYYCLVGLGLGSFILYRLTKFPNLLFILIVLFSLITYLILNTYCNFIDREVASNCIYLYILYNCFLSLSISEVSSYKIKPTIYPSKKVLFILTLLYTFLAYFIFTYVIYISYSGHVNFFKFIQYLQLRLIEEPISSLINPVCDSSFTRTFKIKILSFFYAITFNRLSYENLSMIINIQIWIIEFLITVYCAWKYVIIACPWLLPSYSFRKRSSWLLFFIKKHEEMNEKK